MSDSKHSEESLFEKCLGLAPEERGAFLDSACGGDDELRNAVLKLLRSHETCGGFLETMNQADFTELTKRLERIAPSEESSGDQIGRYRLLELLGEGAWGSVWMAQQTQDIERRVALKILKLGLDTKDFLARFEAERQMLAMMDHPNIARVIDAGATDFGRPYLVMELVKGVPLMEFCDKKRLSLERRVKLFIKICEAIQHAHQKGIIHRDLKPSNILVGMQDDEAVPKVIDFGVAKTTQYRLTDKTLFTNIHTFIGTPLYSSPEQLEFRGQDVDPRSDVYSLGTLLYELLCGRLLFDVDKLNKAGMNAFRTLIQEEDPPRPSQRFGYLSEEERTKIASSIGTKPVKLQSDLEGDLDWVIMRCLEKDPDRRYVSAIQLAGDLQAYLDGNPVTAAAPSFTYRIRKFITRKRPAYTVWLEVTSVLVLVLAIVSLFRPPPAGLPHGESALTNRVGEVSPKTIAVLPFANISDEDSYEYFSDGISEELLNVLARIPNLRVSARTSSFYFRGKDLPIQVIGEQLNVEYVLEGSVRKVGDQVRISANLVKTSDGYHIWSETFTLNLKDIKVLEDEIVARIAQKLQLELGIMHRVKQVNPEAHRLLLEARFHTNQRGFGNLDMAESLLNRSLDIDPNFAEALALMAQVRALRSIYQLLDGTVSVGEISDYLEATCGFARQALELDASLVEAMAAMSTVLRIERRVDESDQWIQKALAINPSSSSINLSHRSLLLDKGELLTASQVSENLYQNDPLNWASIWLTANCSVYLQKYEDALRLYHLADSMRSGGHIPSKSYSTLCLWMLGRKSEAISLAREVRKSWPSDPRIGSDLNAIWVLAQAGMHEEVSAFSEVLFAELPPHSYERGYLLTALGKFEEAVPYLERTPVSTLQLLAFRSIFDPYREDPLFHKLLETLDWTDEYARARADIEMAKQRGLKDKG